MENDKYNKVKEENLSTQLRIAVDSKIDLIYDEIKKNLLKCGALGYTSINIYFPINKQSITYEEYDIRMNFFYQQLNDEYIRKQFVKKFKTEGVKLEIYHAHSISNFRTDPIKCTGYIFKFKWHRDYSKKKSCNIM
jgi:hypothetical protein